MTSSSRRKRQTTAQPSCAARTRISRAAAVLAAGLFGAAGLAGSPVEVCPTPPPATSPVTVYYERLPSGELRKVTNSAPNTPKAIELKPVPAQPGIEFRAAAAPAAFTPVAPAPVAIAPLPAAPKIEVYSRPASPIVVAPAAMPTPVQPNQPVTYSYYKVSNGAIQPVTYQQGDAPAPTVMKPIALPAPEQNPQPTKAAVQLPEPQPTKSLAMQIPEPQPTIARQVPSLPVMPSAPASSPSLQMPAMSMLMQQTPVVPANQESGKLADYGIEIEPPTPGRLYRFESEAELRKRIADEIRGRPIKPGETKETVIDFPKYRPLTDEAYAARKFGGLIKQIEPNYVMYGRLYTQELNSEQYGWDFGVIQPLWSAGAAFKDFALLPYNFAVRPHQRFETSAGNCYPGDPVPYLIYPLEVSATGAGWETFAFLAAFALIP